MRFAWTIHVSGADLAELAGEAAAAEQHGFDAVWIAAGGIEPFAAAAFLATATTGARIGVTVELGDDHPVEAAERAAVADLALGGRLVLGVRPAPACVAGERSDGVGDDFAEAVDLLLAGLGSHPFRHEGPRWPTPANLDANRFHVESRVRVTPAPAQFELPVWVAGSTGRPVAVERGLGVIIDTDEDPADVADWWASSGARPIARRCRRSVTWDTPWSGDGLDVEAAVETLGRWQRNVDVDMAIVDAGPLDPARRGATMAAVMRDVRPRLQLDRLPPGLVDHWADETRSDPPTQQGATDG